jgi:hypothetical protein
MRTMTMHTLGRGRRITQALGRLQPGQDLQAVQAPTIKEVVVHVDAGGLPVRCVRRARRLCL